MSDPNEPRPGYPGELAIPSAPASAMRRRIDVSAGLELLLALPAFLSSLVVVWLAGFALPPRVAWTVPLLWILSGPLIFVPAVEPLIARLLLGKRRPTPAEQGRLGAPWNSVCRAAGVDPHRYSLWITESTEINASASAGRLVSVTTAALDLPPSKLEAVLAHELGHHLSGHPAVSLAAWWYAIPGRLSTFIMRRCIRILAASGRLFLFLGHTLAALASAVMALFLLIVLVMTNPWLVVVPLTTLPLALPLAWASRIGEIHADQVAARLGYGPALMTVLHQWISEGDDEHRRRAGIRARMLASHPSCADRLARLDSYLRNYPVPYSG
ncbi:MAG TPA: M48 family metalloprotease [Mycobacteriales bacterium]|nr:M48 family metalloprotease [Mycobacteriales bacterium]